jgi:hypothetical protein
LRSQRNDQIAVGIRYWAAQRDQTPVRLASECGYAVLDLASIANMDVRFVSKADIPHLLTKQLGVSIFIVVAERKEQHNEEQRHKIAEPA